MASPTPWNPQELYDPEAFRRAGHETVDLLADYLGDAEARGMDVLPSAGPEAALERWPPAGSPMPLDEILRRVVAESSHQHHPGYVGQQMSAPLPLTALTAFTAALLNNSTAIFQGAPVGTVLEKRVVAWMSSAVGYGDEAGGVLVSGGSLGNLTALLAARQLRLEGDVWLDGIAADGARGRPAILVSSEAHYSVGRAAGIMGLGEAATIPVSVDDDFRMTPDGLEAALAQARTRGRTPFALVGNACSTATGAVDDLGMLADFSREHGLWLHVDAAHGGSALLSPRLRPRLAGIERADSVVWDAHKMMLMPGVVTGVLFRRGEDADRVFAQSADYLLTGEGGSLDLAGRTLECTRGMLALPVYTALATVGAPRLGAYVEAMFDLAGTFADRIRERPDLELAYRPQANMVCFRVRPEAGEDAEALQLQVRRRVNASGRYFIQHTRLRGVRYLRTLVITPLTTAGDLAELLDVVEETAAELRGR